MRNAVLRAVISGVVLSMLSPGGQGGASLARAAQPASVPGTETMQVPQNTGSVLSAAEAQDALDFHNAKRAEVGTPSLRWSPQLASVAQAWADHLAKDLHCGLQHTQNNKYGENIFAGWGKRYTAVEAAESWYAERPKFTGGALTPANWSPAGHYTQMVWRTTTQIGMGQGTCDGSVVIVAEYAPAGNLMGQKAY